MMKPPKKFVFIDDAIEDLTIHEEARWTEPHIKMYDLPVLKIDMKKKTVERFDGEIDFSFTVG